MDGISHSPSQEGFDDEPVFRLLVSYFDGDHSRAVAEIAPLLEEGMALKDACEMVIASNGFEASFY